MDSDQVGVAMTQSKIFDSIDHHHLLSFLKEKIKDKVFLRYVIRMLKSGVLAEGELTVSELGIPQGSCCSPILANIFAHYVIDEWFDEVVKSHCSGQVELFRYADDGVPRTLTERMSDAV